MRSSCSKVGCKVFQPRCKCNFIGLVVSFHANLCMLRGGHGSISNRIVMSTDCISSWWEPCDCWVNTCPCMPIMLVPAVQPCGLYRVGLDHQTWQEGNDGAMLWTSVTVEVLWCDPVADALSRPRHRAEALAYLLELTASVPMKPVLVRPWPCCVACAPPTQLNHH